MDLLARLQNCTVFSSLDLRPGDHHIGLMPEANLRLPLPQQVVNGMVCGSFWHMLTPRCFLLPYVTGLVSIRFLFTYLNGSTLWKKHLHHLEAVFKHLKEANLKLKLSKCQFFKKHLHYLGHLIS